MDREKFNEILDELEATEAEDRTAEVWDKALGLIRDLGTAKFSGPEDEEPEPEGEEAPPEPSEEMSEAMRERFSALEERAEAAEKMANEERHLRRLREFTADVTENYSALAIEDQGGVASVLMGIKDNLGDEAYGVMTSLLRASNEAVRQGELFAQYSKTGKVREEASGFEARVEQVRQEKFSDLPLAEGKREAALVVGEENPALAEQYIAEYA